MSMDADDPTFGPTDPQWKHPSDHFGHKPAANYVRVGNPPEVPTTVTVASSGKMAPVTVPGFDAEQASRGIGEITTHPAAPVAGAQPEAMFGPSFDHLTPDELETVISAADSHLNGADVPASALTDFARAILQLHQRAGAQEAGTTVELHVLGGASHKWHVLRCSCGEEWAIYEKPGVLALYDHDEIGATEAYHRHAYAALRATVAAQAEEIERLKAEIDDAFEDGRRAGWQEAGDEARGIER